MDSLVRKLRDHGTNPWKTLATEEVYSSPWNSVSCNRVIRPDGNEGDYYVLHRPNGNHIVAVNEQQEVLLVGQWRYPTAAWSWELPGGNCEPGEDRLRAAIRELREETGLTTKRWVLLGRTPLMSGTTAATLDAFFAQDVKKTHEARMIEDGITRSLWVPSMVLPQLIEEGYLSDNATLATLLLYFLNQGISL